MTITEALIIPAFALILIMLLSCLRYRQKYKSIKNHNEALERSLVLIEEKYNDLKDSIKATAGFEEGLLAAKLTTKLQSSRTGYYNDSNNSVIPERYGYAHALIDHGMDTEKIAELLSISVHEAEQLSALSRIGKGR